MSQAAAAPDPRLARGVVAFNAGEFYEAHEIWEDLWNDAVGEPRRALQALVQLAAGYHKLELGVRGGAIKLLARALATWADVRPEAIPIVAVDDVVRDHLAGLRAGADVAPGAAPRLRLVPPARRGVER